MTANTLNRQLATLLGWTNLVDNGGALLGRPPEGAPNSRDQALVPDWEGDWSACGPLIGEHHVNIQHDDTTVSASSGDGLDLVAVGSFGDRDATVRCVIIFRVIAKLEASQ